MQSSCFSDASLAFPYQLDCQCQCQCQSQHHQSYHHHRARACGLAGCPEHTATATAAALHCLAAAPRLPDVPLNSLCTATTSRTAASCTAPNHTGPTDASPGSGSAGDSSSKAAAHGPDSSNIRSSPEEESSLPAACMALAAAHWMQQPSLELQPFVERACSARGFAELHVAAQAALLKVPAPLKLAV